MFATDLPHDTSDVLELPAADIPEAITVLVQRREFSSLVSQIHLDLHSPDPLRRGNGKRALEKLGFPV